MPDDHSSPARRQLLVVVQGLDRTDLETAATPFLEACRERAGGACAALDAPPGRPVVDQLLGALDVDDLRRRGAHSVCRRTVLLRPGWQDDRAALDGLRNRIGGPADVTVLWLRDAAHAAITAGRHGEAHRAALRRADAHAREAARWLGQHGAAVDVTVCGAAPLLAVEHTFDPRPLLRRALGRRDARATQLTLALSHLRIRCPSWPVAQRTADALAAAGERLQVVAADDGLHRALGLQPAELLCVPGLGYAFATTAVCAAPRLRGDGVGPAAAIHARAGAVVTPLRLARLVRDAVARPGSPAAVGAAADAAADADAFVLDEAPDLLHGLRDAADPEAAPADLRPRR